MILVTRSVIVICEPQAPYDTVAPISSDTMGTFIPS
jgi:hypothetical protein